MPAPDALIDQVFDGRYKVVRKLGTGGMANVYLAEDEDLGRRVALKMLDDRHAQDEQFVERFRREAKNAAGLSHPNIVSIYDRGEAEGTYYIAMEFLDGRTLKELLVARGPTPIPVAIDYARQILAALGFAHRNGVVHRDIKPHNVAVAPDGRLKVMDFGIARAGASSQMTETGSIIGTAQYLSPEQARGAPVTPASDIYSVGVVLYEMLTGLVPFTGDTPLEIAMKHLSTVPERPSEQRAEVPHELDSIVLRALAKNPEDRYQSAEEMDADLARAARGQAVAPETEEAATQVLRGAGATSVASAPTEIVQRPVTVMPPIAPPPYGPPTGFYEYDEPIRRRSFWPWLLAAGLVAAAIVAGWYVYTKIQDQLNQSKPVAVPLVEGSVERLAVAKITEAGLKAHVVRTPSDTVDTGRVFDQKPAAGERIDKGNTVEIDVSTGKPKVVVPGVVGQQSTDAVAKITEVGLKADVHRINSNMESGTVTAQDPKPGTRLVKGDKVRINVSQGPKPVAIPPVIGVPYEQAAGTLQGAGFAVARRDVESNDPRGVVVQMDPGGNTLASKGATVTLYVSKGPKESAVPDVSSFSRADAIALLRNSGFKVAVTTSDVQDPALEGVVLFQNPGSGGTALPGTTVTITIGHYVAPPTVPTTTAAPPPVTTDTTATDTTTTDTTTIP